MSLNFTTALELVETKIQRNNVFIDLLETESSILKKSILVFYRLIEHNNKNTDLIKKIIDSVQLKKPMFNILQINN